MKKKYIGLSNEEKIKMYKKENIMQLIAGIICSVVIIIIAIILLINDLDENNSNRIFAISIILFLPFSWWLGYYVPKKENDKKIKQLKEQIRNNDKL